MKENAKNSGTRVIQQLLKYRNISVKELAKGLGYSSPQVLSNKLYRDTLPLNEFVRIVNFLGCEVKTISEDGKNEYIVEYIEQQKKKDKGGTDKEANS